MKTFLAVVKSFGLLVSRIALGLVMVFHGWTRWTGEGGMAAQVAYLSEHNVPQPQLLAWGSMLLEVVGGILMLFGAFVPGVAAVMLVEQILIIAWLRWTQGPSLANGGYEYNLVLAALSLVFLTHGAGKAAVDALFVRPPSEKGPKASKRVDDADPA